MNGEEKIDQGKERNMNGDEMLGDVDHDMALDRGKSDEMSGDVDHDTALDRGKSDEKTLGEAFEEEKIRRHSSEIGVIGRSKTSSRRRSSRFALWSSSEEEEEEEVDETDPYRLNRFVNCQRSDFPRALREIKNGRKCSCWMWYVVPTAPWIVSTCSLSLSLSLNVPPFFPPQKK